MASIKVWVGSAWQSFVGAFVYLGGSWLEIQTIRMWKISGDTGSWLELYRKAGTTPPPPPPPSPAPPPPPPPIALTVTVDESTLDGTHVGAGDVRTFQPATATVSGGVGPYSFHWETISWSYSTPPFAISPNAPTSYFEQAGMASNDYASGSFRVTAVDSLNNSGSAIVDCTWETISRGSTGGPLP